MGEPTPITAQTPLSAGQRIRHKDTGYEWDVDQTVSVFKTEYDVHPGWLLVSPLGRASVVVYPKVLTGGSWLLVGSGSHPEEE